MKTAHTTVAEWVLPAHPDKLCDAIADRFVAGVLKIDPLGQCGVEVACAFDHVFVTGLLGFNFGRTTPIRDWFGGWVRDAYHAVGYRQTWRPQPRKLQLHFDALRVENRGRDWQELRHYADDQCICIGYAQDTPETAWMPGALWAARSIARALHGRQRSEPIGAIGPDGKVIVRGTEDAAGRFTAESVSLSLHHAPGVDPLVLRRRGEAALRDALGADARPELTINAAGAFLCGGPTGDNGTTGKKLVMDAYGPDVPIGGGAWSGKDFHKPDRIGGMIARRLALQCVHLGLGRRVRVQLTYHPNSTAPESVVVIADGREVPLPPALAVPSTREAARAVTHWLREEKFEPLRLGELARWGHIGRRGAWWEPRPDTEVIALPRVASA